MAEFTDPSVDYMAGGDDTFADNYEGTVNVDYGSGFEESVDDGAQTTTVDDWSYTGDETDDPFDEPDPSTVGGIDSGTRVVEGGVSGTVIALILGFIVLVAGGGAAVLGDD